MKARIRLMVLCPPPIASPWSIPWRAISVRPGRIFFRAPKRSAASFFPFSRSVFASWGDFAARISANDQGDVLGLCAGEDLLETLERRDGKDVELESDEAER